MSFHPSNSQPPIAEAWFQREEYPGGITRIFEPYIGPYWSGNIWLVHGKDRDLVIDTGTGIVSPNSYISTISERASLAVALCGYYDHAGGLYSFKERACHPLESDAISTALDNQDLGDFVNAVHLTKLPYANFELQNYKMKETSTTCILNDGDTIDLGDRCLEVIHIPGRTAGSIALWETSSGYLFGGETLFINHENFDFPPQDVFNYERSLEKLATLPVRTVFGGHYEPFGAGELATMVATETGRYS